MAENWGMLNNLASGIKEGLIGYQTQQQIERQKRLLQLEEDKRNPNSQASEAARGFFKSQGIEVPDNSSEGLLKDFGSIASAKIRSQGDDLEKKKLEMMTGQSTPGNDLAKNAYSYLTSTYPGSQIPKPETTTAAEYKMIMDNLSKNSAETSKEGMFKEGLLSKEKQAELDRKSREGIAANKAKSSGGGLDLEQKTMVKDLTSKKANVMVVNNQVKSLIEQLEDPSGDPKQKAASAYEQLKLLNSQLGPDALGDAEVARVGKFLTLEPSPTVGKYGIGPDIKGFTEQVKSAFKRNQSVINSIQKQVDDVQGRSNSNGGSGLIQSKDPDFGKQSKEQTNEKNYPPDVVQFAKKKGITFEEALYLKNKHSKAGK